MDRPLHHNSEDDPKREEEIRAYLLGELPPEVSAAFEKRIEADTRLRNAVEQTGQLLGDIRRWTEQEAPGVERADRLPIPSLPRQKALTPSKDSFWRPLLHSFAFRAAAVTLVFVLGFALGQFTRWNGEAIQRGIKGAEGVREESASGQATQEAPKPESDRPLHLATAVKRQPRPVPASQVTHYATEQDGKVIIETSQGKTGVRSTWVVDAGFSLENATTAERERGI